jgi:hypothetical protein
MTKDELQAALGIHDVEVSTSENGQSYIVRLVREHEGHRYAQEYRLDTSPSQSQIDECARHLNLWWGDTIQPVKP